MAVCGDKGGHMYSLAGTGLHQRSLDGFIAFTCSPDPQSARPRAGGADLNWHQVDLAGVSWAEAACPRLVSLNCVCTG